MSSNNVGSDVGSNSDDAGCVINTEWESWEIDPDDIKIEYRCGSGVTAEVFYGLWNGTAVAVKQIRLGGKRTDKLIRAFKRELSIMVKCRHPNLVLFMGAATKEEPIRVVCEFCEGGTLFDLLHNRDDVKLSWKQKLKMLIDIGKGITYLHACKPPIVHRDLKSLNLLLAERVDDEYDTPIMKIADFGMAKIKDDSNQDMTANAGTYHWMAPEVLVMYEILCRVIPYEETGLEAMKIALAVNR
ncbi:protein kinase kinase kinase, partial [Perkinsus chesapeaki]